VKLTGSILSLMLLAGCAHAEQIRPTDTLLITGTDDQRSICGSYNAPLLPIALLPEGGLAEVSFDVGLATSEEVAVLRRRLSDNGLAVWNDIILTKRGPLLVASGKGNGILKTQVMADRLFLAICGFEQGKSRLVSLRYIPASELTEVF